MGSSPLLLPETLPRLAFGQSCLQGLIPQRLQDKPPLPTPAPCRPLPSQAVLPPRPPSPCDWHPSCAGWAKGQRAQTPLHFLVTSPGARRAGRGLSRPASSRRGRLFARTRKPSSVSPHMATSCSTRDTPGRGVLREVIVGPALAASKGHGWIMWVLPVPLCL